MTTPRKQVINLIKQDAIPADKVNDAFSIPVAFGI